MDYEKKYNEALEKARKLYNDAKANEYKSDMEDYESIFPELAESEDERIRKVIYILMLGMRKEIFTTQDEIVTKEKVLAYLEKQKEQKPAEWSEEYIADVFEKVGLAKIVREQGNDGLTNALQAAMIELSKVGNTEWSEEDEEILKLLILNIGRYKYFGGMSSERIIAFLKALRPQYHGDVAMTGAYKMGKEAGEASHWKPSEEQMKALKVTLDYMPDTFKPRCTLMTLQDDLKKQM